MVNTKFINPIPTRPCHMIYCCVDKSYPCLVGIRLSNGPGRIKIIAQIFAIQFANIFLEIPKIFIFSCLCCCTKRIVSWLVSSRMSTQTTTAPHRPSSNAISRPMPLTWTSLYLDRKLSHSIGETSSFPSGFQVLPCKVIYSEMAT